MRILLANYRYFVSGGPERYMFNVSGQLEALGHQVVPFSIRYSRNRPTPYENYFVPPLAGPDAIRFAEHRWTPGAVLKTLERSFFSREVERAVVRLARDTEPDVAFVLHFLRKLSPSLLVGLKRCGVPIVAMVNDFLLLCPAIYCLRRGAPCSLCCGKSLWSCLRHRCVQDSLGASLVATLSARFHRARRYFDLVDRWIVISEFTRELMVQSGWPERKLELIHLFAGPEFFAASPAKAAPGYVLYCGNFEPHKGADVLIRAYAQAVREGGAPAPRLKMAGGLDSPSAARCRELARELGVADRVEFPGFADAGGLAGLYAGALFTVIPSRWYENVPNVLIESYACGTAVLGTGHGSLAPLVEEGQTGRLFPPGDPAALAEAMRRSWSDPEWCRRAGLKAREKARALFSAQRHIESLLALFREVTGKN